MKSRWRESPKPGQARQAPLGNAGAALGKAVEKQKERETSPS